ncbi:hypothetical protein LTR66_016571, partial [Elasticomyces elasticus]
NERKGSLEKHTAGAFPRNQQRGSGGGLKHVVDTFACQRRALKVFSSAKLQSCLVAFFGRHEVERFLTHSFHGQGIFAKILL